MVIADAAGKLSTQAIPTATNQVAPKNVGLMVGGIQTFDISGASVVIADYYGGGYAGAGSSKFIRCDDSGNPDPDGDHWKGVNYSEGAGWYEATFGPSGTISYGTSVTCGHRNAYFNFTLKMIDVNTMEWNCSTSALSRVTIVAF